MKLNVALMVVLIVIFYESPVSGSSLCNPNIDAFEYMKTTKRSYIKYQTYNSSRICVFFNQTEIDDATKVARYVVTSFRATTATTETRIQVNKIGNCSNQVKGFDEKSMMKALAERVPFKIFRTDEEHFYDNYLVYADTTCGIYSSTFGGSACAMYVTPEATDENIQDCLEPFEEMCGTTKFDVYPSTCSANP